MGDEEDTFLGAICDTDQSEPRTIQLSFNNNHLEFKIDSGDNVTAIPETKYNEIRDGPLQQTSKILKGPIASKQLLKVRTFVTANIAREELETIETVYIIEGLQKPLVGHPAIQALGLVAWIQTIDTSSHNRSVIEKFPQLYSDLGTIEGVNHIKLKPDPNPFVLSTPRRKAIPLQLKMKTKLQRMERLG